MTLSPYILPGLHKQSEITMTRIIERACKLMLINKDWIISKCRKHEYVNMRCMIVKMLRDRGYTTKAIGKALTRDHSTVIHATATHNDLYHTDEMYRNNYIGLTNAIMYDIPFQPIRKEPKTVHALRKHRELTRLHVKKWIRECECEDFLELNEPDYNLAMCVIGLYQRATPKYRDYKFRTVRIENGMRKIIREC